jgi:hypothetical protein
MRKAMAVISYIYSNPAKDNLVSSVDNYPGFSTWEMFQTGNLTKTCKRIRRPQYRALAANSHNLHGYTEEAKRLLNDTDEQEEFTIEPNAWLEAFKITDPAEQARINARVIAHIRHLEARAERLREKGRKTVIGREKLLRQKLDLSYRPSRSGKKMWGLSERRSIRVRYIRFIKKLRKKAREVLALWRSGDMTAKYPPGLYPPSMPKLANVIAA